MKIPDKLFIGLNQTKTEQNPYPLGFMCQYDNGNAAFQKRKFSIIKWCRRSKENYDGEPVFDNEPITGFRITKSVSRWSTSNKMFRVQDPRGFELEISTGNLEMLLPDVVIDAGVFKGKMLWGRDGSNNVLLSVNSEPYMKALEATKVHKKTTIPVSKLNKGDVCINKDGNELTYIGRWVVTLNVSVGIHNYRRVGNYYNQRSEVSYDNVTKVTEALPVKHFFIDRFGDVVCYSNPGIVEVTGTTSYDKPDKTAKWGSANSQYKYNNPIYTRLVKELKTKRTFDITMSRGHISSTEPMTIESVVEV